MWLVNSFSTINANEINLLTEGSPVPQLPTDPSAKISVISNDESQAGARPVLWCLNRSWEYWVSRMTWMTLYFVCYTCLCEGQAQTVKVICYCRKWMDKTSDILCCTLQKKLSLSVTLHCYFVILFFWALNMLYKCSVVGKLRCNSTSWKRGYCCFNKT